MGEESLCLQSCWVTEIGHGNLGAIRNIMACRKEGSNWEFICLLPAPPAKSKAVLAHSVNEIQVPPRSLNGQERDNRHRFPSYPPWHSSSVCGWSCVTRSVRHLPPPKGFCTFPWEQSRWQEWERANIASSHSSRHANISWQNSVQTNISLTAILICHSVLFNTSS